jgi:hypothetical protein
MPLFSLAIRGEGIGSYTTQFLADSPYEAIRTLLRGPSLNQFLMKHSKWPRDFRTRDIYAFFPFEGAKNFYFCGLGQKGKYVEILISETVQRSPPAARYCGPRRKTVTLR